MKDRRVEYISKYYRNGAVSASAWNFEEGHGRSRVNQKQGGEMQMAPRPGECNLGEVVFYKEVQGKNIKIFIDKCEDKTSSRKLLDIFFSDKT